MFQFNIFQEMALGQIKEQIRNGSNKILLSMPPETGKTFVAIDISKIFSKVLYITHHNELVFQSYNFWVDFLGKKDCKIINKKSFDLKKFNFITIQKAHKNLDKLKEKGIDCIIVDEAHHALAKSYLKVINDFNGFVLGLTATPFRLDKGNVVGLFDNNIVLIGDIQEAIERGYLTKFSYYGFKDDIDYSNIKFKGHDYSVSDLDKRLFVESRDIKIIEKYREYLLNKKTIAFCNSIKHTKRCLQFFRNEGIKCESLTNETSNKERKRILNEFKASKNKLIFSINILNEGMDFPDVEAVMLLRPSASYGLILQQIGRALRRHSTKDRAIILDFVGNHPFSYNIRNILSTNRIIRHDCLLNKPLFFYPEDCEVYLERVVEDFMDGEIVKVFLKDMVWICREYFELKKKIGRKPFEQDILIFGKNNLINFVNVVGIFKLWFYMQEKIRKKDCERQKFLDLAFYGKLTEVDKRLIRNYFKEEEFDFLISSYKKSQFLRFQKLNIKGRCPRCLFNKVKSPHHITPREDGGEDNKENIIWLCEDCHNEVELNQDEWFKKYGLRDPSIIRKLILNNYF